MIVSAMVENHDNRKTKQKLNAIPREVDEKTLGTLIYQKLDEMRHGDLYQIEGFTEKDYKILLSDDDKFFKFVTLLGKSMGSIETAKNPDMHKKEMKVMNKEYVNKLKLMPMSVKKQIKAHQLLIASNPDGHASSPDQKRYEKKLSDLPDTDSVAQTGDELHDEEGYTDHSQTSKPPPRSSQKQKGKKGKKKKKPKGKGSKSKKEIPIVENPEELEEEVEEDLYPVEDTYVPNPAEVKAEREFNLAKEDILSEVDTAVKADFLQIGFSRWSGTWLPIIQLSPYDPPPGKVRTEWMRIHNKVNKKKMPRFFYWYGTKRDENAQNSAFSFAQKTSVCSYDEGVKKGRNLIPDKTQKKIDAGKKLTDTEILLVEGLKEQEIELKLPGEERVEWIRGNEIHEEFVIPTAPIETEEKKPKGKVCKTKTDDGNASSKKRKKTKNNEVPVAADQAKNDNRKRKKDKSSGISNDDEQGKKKTPRSKRRKTDPVIKNEDEQDVAMEDAEIENLGDEEPDDSLIIKSDTNGVEAALKSKKSTQKSNRRNKGITKQRPPSTEDIKISSVKKEDPGIDDILHGTNPEEDVETTYLDVVTKKVKKKGKKKKKKPKACEEVSEHEPGKDAISNETEPEHVQTTSLKKLISPTSNGSHSPRETKDLSEKKKKKKRRNRVENNKVDDKVESVDRIKDHSPDENMELHENIASVDSADERQSAKCDSEDSEALSAADIKPDTSTSNPVETSNTIETKNEDRNKNLATDCDTLFIPLKQGLSNAVKNNDIDKATQNLEDIRQNIGSITPLFIKEYKLGMLIKRARNRFSSDDELVALARSVTKAMKKEFYKYKESTKGSKIKKEPKEDGGVQKPNLNVRLNGHVSDGDTNVKTEPLGAVMAVPKKAVLEVDAPKSLSKLALFNKPPIRGTPGKNLKLQHKQLPRWLTEDISSEPMDASFQNNPERTFAFEFFVMAVEVFTTKKDMNQATIARGLEDATHQMHKKDIKKYWEKVHAICGTIVGKSNKPGISLLADHLMKGKYSYPMEIIELPLKKLYESFEGSS